MRHKVSVVAVLSLGVFALMPREDDAQAANNSPWSKNAPVQMAQAEEPAFLGDVFDSAVDDAVDYLDDAGLNPVDMTEDSVGNWGGASDAFESADNR